MAIGQGPGSNSLGPWRTLFDAGSAVGLSDAELLARSVERDGPASELAFATLVERHGPMVLRVCRKAVGDPHEAHDAFQSTFLILAKKARSIRKRDSLASFLHGVALRVSAASRASAARRRHHERNKATLAGANPARPDPEWAIALQEEVGRLPRPYREAVILCYLEGKTGDEAAALLDCPVGTIKSRLSWARDRLRDRLVRRGIATTAGASAMVASEAAEASVSVPSGWAEETASLAWKFARGAAGEVPATISAVAKKVIFSMILSKTKWAVVALAIGSAASGTIWMTRAGGQEGPAQPAKGAAPPLQRAAAKDKAIREMLDKMVEIDLPANSTLEDLIKAIKAASKGPNDNGIPNYLDPIGLQEADCTLSTPVPLDVKKAKLGRLLADALAPLKLSYLLRDGLLTISSREANLDERLEEINRKLDVLIEAQTKAKR